MPICCLLIDDEQPALDELRYVLESIQDVVVIGETRSPSRAADLVLEMQPDLVFLDIHMPGMTGFDVLQAIRNLATPPLVVFVTAYDQHAVDAFEANAVDYVLKPYSEDRIRKTVERSRDRLAPSATETPLSLIEQALSRIQSPPPLERIAVEDRGRIRLVDPDAICFFSTEEGRTRLHTNTEVLFLHNNPGLERLEDRLAPFGFFRIHRGFLANLARIAETYPWFNGKYQVVMDDAERSELPVSRHRVKAFKATLCL